MAISKDFMVDRFLSVFGGERDGVDVYFAPGQVNFIGDHTDYNGGHILPCALTMGTYAAIRRRDGNMCRVASAAFPETGIYEFPLDSPIPDPTISWVNYPKGSVWSLVAHGYRPTCAFDIYYDSDLPLTSGLSSSGSIDIATIYAVAQEFGFDKISPIELALIGQDAENSFVNVECGILSTFMAVFGKKDYAAFLKTSSMHYKYTPLSLLGKRIILTHSGLKHDNMKKLMIKCQSDCRKGMRYLSEHIFIQRLCDVTSDQFETYKDMIPYEDIRRRVKHVVYENQRATQAYNALNVGNIAKFGRLMKESHISLRDDFRASCPEVDCLVEAAWETPGVIGSRMTGVGFGGCTVSIVENDAVDRFIESVGKTYTDKTGRTAAFYVADTSDGVHKLQS